VELVIISWWMDIPALSLPTKFLRQSRREQTVYIAYKAVDPPYKSVDLGWFVISRIFISESYSGEKLEL
jgi:hypothetical protein